MIDLSHSKLTFDDEFNSLSLGNGATGTWQPAYSWATNGTTDPTLTSWTMNPAYGPTSAPDANVYSDSNGILSIAFKPTPADVNPAAVGNKPFLSGQLTTHSSFSQTYGYFEANAKLPAAAGLNSAFWLLPADGSWPPELDAEEVLGNDPTTLVMTAHSNVNGADQATPHWTNIPNASQGFHTYGVDWEPSTITWYFDGNQVAQQATPSDMNKPMYMLLDTLSGTPGSWIGAPKAGETAQMQVNYVRAYSSNPNVAAVTPQSGYAPDYGAPGTAAPVTTPVPAPPVGAPPATTPVGALPPSGADTIALQVSEDAWQGDAQFTVSVDGTTVGGVRTATASHATGATNAVTLAGSWGAGAHSIGITFINDSYGGTAQTDRNLYVEQVTYDGSQPLGQPAAQYSNGTATFQAPATAASISFTLAMAEDAWGGDAQYSVSIDGQTVGNAGTVTASHALGQSQAVSFQRALSAGQHDVGVTFLNDAYGGSSATDRNLYVDSIALNGSKIAGAAATLWSDGTSHFNVIVPAHA